MGSLVELQPRIDSLDPHSSSFVTQLVDLVLNDALARSVSDVHVQPTPALVQIRYRLDGVLQEAGSIDGKFAVNVVSRLKVMAGLLTYRQDVPQEGRMDEASQDLSCDMRLSTFPTVHGEKAVVRIFEPRSNLLELSQLGLTSDLYETLCSLLMQPSGAIFLTGPSGSGKTTTIYAALRFLVQASQAQRHLVSIEDPVEQVLDGVSQSQVKPGSDFDFARGLRSVLRQDPEVIMIGEVRDKETAAIAVEAALTGHLVITTLHASSACGVAARLLEMGIEPYLLTSSLRGILNQRLARRACEQCAGGDSSLCSACSGTGYSGRFLLSELITLTPPLRQAILAKSDTDELERAARPIGNQTIRDDAEQAVRAGKTTREEIERVLGAI